MNIIPGMELSRMLYEEEIKDIMGKRFSDVKYAVATMGMCSEVLGLDDKVSMDHEWGPLIQIFVDEKDKIHHSRKMMRIFREMLPKRFKGFDTKWKNPRMGLMFMILKMPLFIGLLSRLFLTCYCGMELNLFHHRR